MAVMTIRRLWRVSAIGGFVILQASVPGASAQSPDGKPRHGWRGSVSAGSLHQPAVDLDSTGELDAIGGFVRAAFTGPLNRHGYVPGVAFGYEYRSYDFPDPTAFGANAPWTDVQHLTFSVPVVLQAASRWSYLLAPSVHFSRATGAQSEEALSYGGAFAALRRVDPERQFGFGVSVLSGLEETRVMPVIVVDWKLSDSLRLVNTPSANPIGNGIELEYRVSARWSLGGGAGFQWTRFRLSETGPFPDGIGEQRGGTAFMHAGWRLNPQFSVDFYAAGLVGGRLRVENADGDELIEEDFDVAPVLGATITAKF
jgi:hypothetical protein